MFERRLCRRNDSRAGTCEEIGARYRGGGGGGRSGARSPPLEPRRRVRMIIDSHCHLHDPVFDDTRSAVTRAIEHDVWGIVAVGGDAASNLRTLEAAAQNGKMVWPAFGFHPEWATHTDEELDLVED